MTREETNHSHGVESQSRIVKSESLRDKVVATLPGFILTGVVGTMLCAAALTRNLGGDRYSGSVRRNIVFRPKKAIVSRDTGNGMRSGEKNKFAPSLITGFNLTPRGIMAIALTAS